MIVFKDRREFIGILICVISAVIFGLYPPASRGAYQDGANITFVILVTTFCRFAGLYALAFMKKKKIFQDFHEYKTSLYAGIFQALSIIGILGGAFFMPGAVVIIIMFSYSLMLLFFSAWRKEMKLNIANITSTLTALLGLGMVLNIGSDGFSYPLIGIALAFMAAVATFARTYIFGQQSKKARHPLVTGTETFAVASFLLLLLLFWELPEIPQSSFGGLMTATAALSLTLGSFGMFYGISYLGSYKFSMIMKLEPIFTTLFGIVLIGDVLAIPQYAGIVLVLASLISLQLFDRQKTR